MPTVTRVGDTRIRQTARPTILTGGQAPAGAFGEDLEGITQEVRTVAAGIKKRADQELDKANKLWFMRAENKLADKQLDIESRAEKMNGEDAFGLHDETKKEFDSFAAEIEATAKNETQRLELQGIKTSRSLSLNRFITGHVDNEIEVVETQESEALRFNLSNSASSNYEDPVRLGEDKFKFDAAVADEVDRQGLGSEAKKAFTLEQTSGFHSRVLSQMLSNGDNAIARQYFKDNGDQITENAKLRLQPAIDEAGLRADSQAKTDSLVNNFDTWEKRFDEAKKIKDPELRDEVTRRLDRERGREVSLERESDNQNYLSSLNDIEDAQALPAVRGEHPRFLIDPTRWERMSKAQRDSLIRMSGFGVKPDELTNFDLYREYYSLPPEEKAKMNHSELSVRYLSHFDKAYRKAATDIWVRDSDAVATGSHVKGQATPTEFANRFLRDIGFLDTRDEKLDGDQKKKYNIFIEIFERQNLAFQKKHGKEPNEVESKDAARKIWEETIRITDGDDAETLKFGEALEDTGFFGVSPEELRRSGLPFRKVENEKVVRKGIGRDDIRTIENALRSVWKIGRPEGFDIRAERGKQGLDFGIRATTKADSLYSNLIQQFAKASRDRDEFKAKQLVLKYKKDLEALK